MIAELNYWFFPIYIAHNTMGAVFRPKDLPDGWRKRVQESIKDFSPDTKDTVLKIMDSWEGTKSEEKLKELLGHDKAENLKKTTRRTMVI
jgi:hypothetical protein